ncbi:hypothetical protein SAMN04487759_11631 [Kandleria vitulina]|uniref:Uncharacterized protein n=1 Tax=Kandleria vitulina TaxID=1630 RepID=A0A1H2TV36_9FIRM|nr:hypothetical protein [Kandleria vitulina]SDW47755.1 hypothetical protein SAMN04487759_11631 [Kandleria vitulina]
MRYGYEFKRKCVEMYHRGEYPQTPNGISEERFHWQVRKWVRIEESCGPDALRHKNQNKEWTLEERYALVAPAYAAPKQVDTNVTKFSFLNKDKVEANKIYHSDDFYLDIDWDASSSAPLSSLKDNYNKMSDDVFKIRARVSGAEHQDMLHRTDGYMTAWMLYHLQNDEEAGKAFIGDDAEILINNNWQDIEKNQ